MCHKLQPRYNPEILYNYFDKELDARFLDLYPMNIRNLYTENFLKRFYLLPAQVRQ